MTSALKNQKNKTEKTVKKAKRSPKNQTVNSPLETIGSEERLAALIAEAEAELAVIEPKIEKLEAQLAQLNDLKMQRQKLLTFKLSLQAINTNYASLENNVNTSKLEFNALGTQNASKSDFNVRSAPFTLTRPVDRGNFDADEALRQARRVLRTSSLNFQLFQALVVHGGAADTPAVKQYLLAQDVRQPGSGENFDAVALTSISSRLNYLVRKGLAEADGRGGFICRFGWVTG